MRRFESSRPSLYIFRRNGEVDRSGGESHLSAFPHVQALFTTEMGAFDQIYDVRHGQGSAAKPIRITMPKPTQSPSPSGTQWITDTGVRVPAVTEAQMREVDRIAIEETGPNLFQMMENAGRNLALAAIGMLGDDWRDARVLVLAGSGGNGGGGICAARHLANRNVDVGVCLAAPDRLGEVPSFQLKIFGEAGGTILEPNQQTIEGADFILDALIGYSLRGAPGGITADLIKWANECETPVLSLDIPSGVESTTGETPGVNIQPNSTLTLALPKTGLTETNAGEVTLADIGIPAGVYRRMGLGYENPFDSRYGVPISQVPGGF